ncbi:hypothetical protein BH09PLA1_BH09PLA1_00190 [soil metagenome]
MNTQKNKWDGQGAIVVARQSDDGLGTTSTEAQLDHIWKKLAEVGMHVVDKEMLDGVPASAPARITEILERLFKRKKRDNDFDVIAWQIEDRATRGGGEFGMWLEHEAKRHGLRVYFADSDMADTPYASVVRVSKYEAAKEQSVGNGRRTTPMGCNRLYCSADDQPKFIIRNVDNGLQEQIDFKTKVVIGNFGSVGKKSRNRFIKQRNEYSLLIPGDRRQQRVVRVIFYLRYKRGWRGEVRQRIGRETSWQVEFIPGHFERLEHVRFKYACKHCEYNAENPNIALADKPAQPIGKGMAGPGLLAYVVTSKFSDFLPLYRLQNISERNGLEISRATQSVWCRDVAEIVKPVYDLMIQRMLQSHVICTDDTVMPMLAPEKTRKARMWVCLGDEHNPYNLFYFTLGRGRDGLMTFLKRYKQTLVADAYGGYDGVDVGNDITRAGCWAHVRRKFVDAEKTHPAIPAEAVGIIRQLNAIEEQAKGKTDDDRLRLRQAQSQPILLRFRERLWAWKDQLLPKHPMAEAVGYVLNQWSELNVFTTDGAVPIDNNVSEREMKRICLNRKNSLFVGNERGGQTAAILSSLTSTCRRHAIDPQLYLTQLLTNLPAMPMSQISQWLPDYWKRRNPSPSA